MPEGYSLKGEYLFAVLYSRVSLANGDQRSASKLCPIADSLERAMKNRFFPMTRRGATV
jgi:hypothetical protein